MIYNIPSMKYNIISMKYSIYYIRDQALSPPVCWVRLNWQASRCLSDLHNGSLSVGERMLNEEITESLNSESFLSSELVP